jgi:RimJ/RimL family protein N-acetyltransferase
MSEIETERLLLRPFRESDAADVLEYLSGPLPHCFAGLHLDTLEEARAEVLKRSEDTEYCFAIVLKETGRVIGEIDAESSDYMPPMLRSREMLLPPPDTFTPSLILNAAHQGSGYAYEATYALFDYLFSRKSVRRIYSYVDDYNARSQHLCEKLGMHREGLFRSFVSFVNDADGNPVYENTIQYAILKHEWIAGRKRSAI